MLPNSVFPAASALTRLGAPARKLLATVAPANDLLAPEVLLGRESVVSGAAQSEIVELVRTALGEWHDVMDLNEVRFGTAPP